MSGKDEKKVEDGYTNAFWSVLEPVMGGKQIQGTAQYVAREVLVGQLVRRMLSLPMNWRESAEIHLYSVPMIGTLNFGKDFRDPPRKDDKSELTDAATDGAKAIPGAIAGYIAQSFRVNGVRMPEFRKAFVALCLGKILSQVIMEYVSASLPNDIQTAEAVLRNLFNKYREIANLKSEKEER